MSFADGFSKGYAVVADAMRMRDDRKQRAKDNAFREKQQSWAEQDRINKAADRQWELDNRQANRDWEVEQRGITRDNATRQGDLATLQLEDARRVQAQAKLREEREAAVRSAGVRTLGTAFEPGKTEGEQVPVFTVGAQRFGNRAAAEAALAQENAPVAVAKRQWQKAQELGDPTLAKQYYDGYTSARASAMEDLRTNIGTAYAERGVQGVLDVYNNNVQDGRRKIMTPGPDGSMVVGTYVGGKLQGEVERYKNPEEFVAHQRALFAANPDAYLDYYHRKATLDQGASQFSQHLGLQRDQLKVTARGQDMSHRVGMANVGVGAAGVAAQREAMVKPAVNFVQTDVPDGQGGTATSVGATVYDPKTGKLTQHMPPQPFAGVRRAPPVSPLAALLPGQQKGAAAPINLNISEEGLIAAEELLRKRREAR